MGNNWYRAEKDQVARADGFGDYELAVSRLYLVNKWSMSEIARYFNVTSAAIRYNLVKQGVPMRPRGGKNNATGKGGRRKKK